MFGFFSADWSARVLFKLVLAILVLICLYWGVSMLGLPEEGAALTIAVALIMAIVAVCKLMVWESERRSNAEQREFQLVNTGQKEPDPNFLRNVWNQ